MRLNKYKNELGITDFILKENDKKLFIFYMGNGDLYWKLNSPSLKIEEDDEITPEKSDYFMITKENYPLYALFAKLYYDIENINIRENEINKEDYIKHNLANYQELFNKDKKQITWYSDETYYEVANILKITKEEDTFRLEFFSQPPKEGYDEEYNSISGITIRFRNSGSRYNPFNTVFMRMFSELNMIDDINDNYHQYHIEEYLYLKNKPASLTRKK